MEEKIRINEGSGELEKNAATQCENTDGEL